MNSHSVSKQAAVLIAGRGGAFLFTFFIPIFLVRFLTPTEYGTFKQVFLIHLTLINLLPFGIVQSLYYFIPREPEHRRIYLIQSILFLLIIGGVASLALVLGRGVISTLFHNPQIASYLILLGAFTYPMLVCSFFETILISGGQVKLAAISLFLSEVLRTGFMIVPLFFIPQLAALMAGLVLYALLRALLIGAYVFYHFRYKIEDLGWPLLRHQMAYAVPFGLAIVVQVFQENFHQFAVSYRFDPATFAIFSVAMFHVPLVDLVYSPMSQLMIVRLAELLRIDEGDAILQLFRDLTKHLAIIFFPLFVFFQLVAQKLIILLFTARYQSAVPLFRTALWMIPLSCLMTDGMLRVYAETRFILKANLLKLVLSVVLVLILLPWLGLVGGVLTPVVILLVTKGVMLWKMGRMLGASLSRLVPWRVLFGLSGTALLSGVPVWVLIRTVHGPPIEILILSGLLYGPIYLVLLFNSSALEPQERQWCLEWLRRQGKQFFSTGGGVPDGAPVTVGLEEGGSGEVLLPSRIDEAVEDPALGSKSGPGRGIRKIR